MLAKRDKILDVHEGFTMPSINDVDLVSMIGVQ